MMLTEDRKKKRKIIYALAALGILAIGLAVLLTAGGNRMALKGLQADKVSAAIGDWSGDEAFNRKYLTPEETEYLIETLKEAKLERIDKEEWLRLYNQMHTQWGAARVRVTLEEEEIVAHQIDYRPADKARDGWILLSVKSDACYYKSKSENMQAAMESLFAETIAEQEVRMTGYVSPIPLTEETRVCPDTCSPQEAVEIYAREYTQKKFVGQYTGPEEWGRVTEYTAIRPELVTSTMREDTLLGRYEYAMETEHMENFYPVGGLDYGLGEYSNKIYSADAFILTKADGYWHFANHGSDCWLDEELGLMYYAVPFEKREFKVEAHVASDAEGKYPDGLIYKSSHTDFTNLNYLRVYGSGTYELKNSQFIVTGGENGDWPYEDIWWTGTYHENGGMIYIDADGNPYEGVAVAIEDPYTEYQLCSRWPVHGYRIYEIQRDGADSAGDYKEYWMAYYFEGVCRHVFNIGHVYNSTNSYKISESLNLIERYYGRYSNGTDIRFFLQDEETGKEIPLSAAGSYMDFAEAVDENHLIFYCHGRNQITESYYDFPYLLHQICTDRSSDEFQMEREQICFLLDEVTVAGKQADCMLNDVWFTEDGVILEYKEDPDNPMSFYMAYSDVAWTRISWDEQQKALRLTTRSVTRVDEEMISALEVPEDHPYIAGFALERKDSGMEILLYLKDGANGYYGATDSGGAHYPRMEIRLTDEAGRQY